MLLLNRKTTAVHSVSVVVIGVHEFFIDTKTYYSVATDIWSGKPLGSFTRKELETYQQVNTCTGGNNACVNGYKFMCINWHQTCFSGSEG